MGGCKHHHAVGNVCHVPAAAVVGLAGHALEDEAPNHRLGIAQTLNGNHDEGVGIIFAEGILGLKLDEEALTGKAAFERSLKFREDVPMAVQVGEALGTRFLKNLSGHVRHANGQGYEHVFLDGKRHVYTPSRTQQTASSRRLQPVGRATPGRSKRYSIRKRFAPGQSTKSAQAPE